MAIIYLSLRCHYQNDSCIRMGHFNVSLITVRDSHKTVSTDHFSRERTAEAELSPGLSAYQPTALPLGQTGSQDSMFLPQLLISAQTFRSAPTASVDRCADIRSTLSVAFDCGRVWR